MLHSVAEVVLGELPMSDAGCTTKTTVRDSTETCRSFSATHPMLQLEFEVTQRVFISSFSSFVWEMKSL